MAFQLSNGPMSFAVGVPSPDGKKMFALGWLPGSELVRYDSRSGQFTPFFSGISAGELHTHDVSVIRVSYSTGLPFSIPLVTPLCNRIRCCTCETQVPDDTHVHCQNCAVWTSGALPFKPMLYLSRR
jgi:hypothetical protein